MTSAIGYSLYTSGSNTNNTFMQWLFLPNYSWYSQIGSYFRGWETGTFDYANSNAFALNNLLIESFTIDGNTYNNKSILYPIQDSGCHLCAFSMVLANHDIYTQTARYDVRSGRSARIFADPYAVAMANFNLSNWSIAADGLIEGNYNEPSAVYYSRIENEFNCEVNQISLKTATLREKANTIIEKIDLYGSVILRFNGHSMVAVATTCTTATPLEYLDFGFYVFDPGTSIASRGSYVTISETSYGIEDVESVFYLTFG